MKKTFLAVLATAACVVACTPKQAAAPEATSSGEYESAASATDGVQRMHEYNFSDTVVVDGRQYIYKLHREASDSLPVVTDDEGTRYADNIYTLTIMAGGQQFFHRTFTKAAFASYLSNEFRQQGILDGMMLDTSLSGLAFAVSVSMPQSDMLEPLLLHVDRQGGITIERDERSDADIDDSADEGV